MMTDKSIYEALDECVVSLSTELGAAGAVKAKVGRGGRDGARLPTAAAVTTAAAGPRQHRDGAQACADLHLTRRQRYAFLTLSTTKYSYKDDVS